MKRNKNKLVGVNLGGWLVLEKWITPSLFEGTEGEDEFNLLKSGKKVKVEEHYQNFIKEEDFKFLADTGINALRIPLGYWLFGNQKPYLKTVNYLDFAFEMANKYGFKVLVDLHGAPGSQNGYDHSGKVGEIGWDKHEKNVLETLDIIKKISKRYCKNKSLFGIELLNEPHETINFEILKDYYDNGYQIIRDVCGERVTVVISDSFRPYEIIQYLKNRNFKNTVIDSHFYQCFTEEFIKMNSREFFNKSKRDWVNLIKSIQKVAPVISGEWSLELKTVDLSHKTFIEDLDKISKGAYKKYLSLQRGVFGRALGYFFWNYKTEGDTNWAWDFKKLVENNFFS